MHKMFYIMGKSSSGKDTIYNSILDDKDLKLVKFIMHTTRPIRTGEKDGVDYHFIDDSKLNQLLEENKVIELRQYNTVQGIWSYLTVSDDNLALEKNDYLMVGTLESFRKMKEYLGKDIVIPIYIEVEDGERLSRAIKRENIQEKPNYIEICRRFLADTEDFSECKLIEAGIFKKFYNNSIDDTLKEIINYIRCKMDKC